MMNGERRRVVWSIGLLLAACRSTMSMGSLDADGGMGGACLVSAGTYTQHFTAEGGGMNCPPLPAQTLTLNGNTSFNGGSAGTEDAGGPGCTKTANWATCTFTTTCGITTPMGAPADGGSLT